MEGMELGNNTGFEHMWRRCEVEVQLMQSHR
jgi:hypothetical protein